MSKCKTVHQLAGIFYSAAIILHWVFRVSQILDDIWHHYLTSISNGSLFLSSRQLTDARFCALRISKFQGQSVKADSPIHRRCMTWVVLGTSQLWFCDGSCYTSSSWRLIAIAIRNRNWWAFLFLLHSAVKQASSGEMISPLSSWNIQRPGTPTLDSTSMSATAGVLDEGIA